jgi:hypothetical protein
MLTIDETTKSAWSTTGTTECESTPAGTVITPTTLIEGGTIRTMFDEAVWGCIGTGGMKVVYYTWGMVIHGLINGLNSCVRVKNRFIVTAPLVFL